MEPIQFDLAALNLDSLIPMLVMIGCLS